MLDTGTHGDYVKEMEKSLLEGKVRRLSRQEMADWHGPQHYITTFAVVKPESLSTKTRVVANSAMRNARARLSLNQCMWPGPNALTDLLDCLIFWRAVQVALMTDLKKAYQSIYTGEMELHLRKFLYRRDPRDPWEDLAFTRATFGDVAAGLVLEVAKRCVAELGREIDPVAAQQLADYSYVDDNLMGGSPEDVERMRGTRVDGSYTGTVPRILAKGAMQVKFMAVSGSPDQWEAEQLAGKTLGVLYRLKEDEIYFVLCPGYYGSKQKSSDQVREIVLLDQEQVDELEAGRRILTRRQALSMVMGVYDPLGLISPALTRGKLLLRRLYGTDSNKGWDADIDPGEKKRWVEWFRVLLIPAEASFPRSTKPDGAVGLPRLVGFGDSSMVALCAVLYVVWTDARGVHHPRVLTGKCRVSPLRGELQALVVLHRLLLTVMQAFPYQFLTVSAYTDLMCSLGALQKSTAALRPFFGNRVMEIIRLREQIHEMVVGLPPVGHVPGEQNPADLGTRGKVSVGDLGPSSTWQVGPAFLRQDYDCWPGGLDRDAVVEDIPREECKLDTTSAFHVETSVPQSPAQILLQEVGQSSELGKAVSRMVEHALKREKLEMATKVVARCLQAVFSGRSESCQETPWVKLMELAVRIMLCLASESAVQALKDGKLRGLGAQVKNRVVWVSGRIRGDKLATLLGTEALPVLLPSEPLARSIMGKAHREDHRRGPRDAAARSRKMVWVTAATRLAKSVIGSCYTC